MAAFRYLDRIKKSKLRSTMQQNKLFNLFEITLYSLEENSFDWASYGVFDDSPAYNFRSYIRNRPWTTEGDFSGIDFNDMGKCRAYLKHFAGCHAALARTVCLDLFETDFLELDFLWKINDLHIASVGGGPGSDLVGFCSGFYSRFVQMREAGKLPAFHLQKLQLTVVDLMSGWRKVFDAVIRKSLANSESQPSRGEFSDLITSVPTEAFFETCDLFKTRRIGGISSADIVLMTKVLSWVPEEKKTTILENVFSSMKPRALFLFIDIDADRLIRKACHLQPFMEVLHISDEKEFNVLPGAHHGGAITKSTYGVCLVQKRV